MSNSDNGENETSIGDWIVPALGLGVLAFAIYIIIVMMSDDDDDDESAAADSGTDGGTTTPTCDLDATTDGTAACPAGGTDTPAQCTGTATDTSKTCDLVATTDDTAACLAGCTNTPAQCTGTATARSTAATADTTPQCVGNLVAPNCNIGGGGRNISACTQRYIKDTTNSTTGYLQCKLKADGTQCNSWNNANKSDKVECNVSGRPRCESSVPGKTGHTWHGKSTPFSNATDLEYRGTSRKMCNCPQESAGGYVADSTNVSDSTNWHQSKNMWSCK